LVPTDLSDAIALTWAAGNPRCARIFNITWPTSPVAPTTATFNRRGEGTTKVYR
jgi:hypothetical protein